MDWSPECWGCTRTETKPSNKTFTLSGHDIQPNRRTKRIKEQTAVAKLATELTIGSMINDHNEAKLHEFPNSLTLDISNTSDKTSGHHQVSLKSNSNKVPCIVL